MAQADEKLHTKIAAGLSDSRVSPQILAMLMHKENRYTNESFLQYALSYIQYMAKLQLVPMHLAEIQQLCKWLNESMEELGLLDSLGRQPLNHTEYLVV